MGSNFWGAIVSVALAIVGLAIIATLVSPKATTSKVIGAGTQGFAADLEAAVSPVTGNTPSFTASYF